MSSFTHILDQRRLIGAGGSTVAGEIYFYYTGTSDLAPVYLDPSLSIPATNPVEVGAGEIIPSLYLDSSIVYRRVILYADGTVDEQENIGNIITGGEAGIPVGCVLDYSGGTLPTGFLLCDGSAVSRTTYADLFAAVGTTYGAGNGSTTFNIPDYRGRVGAGKDNMGGVAASRLSAQITGTTLGATGGAEQHTLTSAQIPAHTHPVTDPGHIHSVATNSGALAAGSSSGPYASTSSTVNTGSSTTGVTIGNNTGGGGAHTNLQPTIICNKIIKAVATTFLNLVTLLPEYALVPTLSDTQVGSGVDMVAGARKAVRPEDYGAVGDGVTNDTAAIQDAIDDAKARKLWVDFGSKTYLVDQLSVTTDNFWFGTNATLKAVDGLNQDVARGLNVSNIWLEGIIFDGDKPTTTSRNAAFGQGLHLLKGSGVVVRHCKGINCLENGMRIIGIDGFYFYSPECSSNGHNGFYGSGYSDGSADLQNGVIINPVTKNNATDGFALEFACKKVSVESPHSVGNGNDHSLYVGGAGIIVIGYNNTEYPEDIQINDPITADNYGGGIYILGSTGVTVSNPRSTNDGVSSLVSEATFGHGIAVYSTSSSSLSNRDITIVNPVINNPAKSGIYLDDNLTTGGHNKGVQILGGVIRNASQSQANTFDGIDARYTNDLVIDGTVIYDDQGSKTMKRPMTVASTCVNPRINSSGFKDGATGNLDVRSTTCHTVRVDSTGKMQVAYGAIGTTAIGATFDLFGEGTGNVDRKIRNNNVTLVETVDSSVGYYGTLTASDWIWLVNNAVRGRVYNTLGSSESAIALLVNDGTTTSLRRVTVGAADSGGSGYRILRVSN